MKNNRPFESRFPASTGSPAVTDQQIVKRYGAMLAFTLLAGVFSVSAATVSLTTSDPSNTSSLNSAGKWSNGQAPNATNDYSTAAFMLRTPQDGNSYTFAGKSLTLYPPTSAPTPIRSIIYKGSGGNIYTIDNLTNAGGVINSGAGNVTAPTFTGNLMTVVSNSTIQADQGSFIIGYPLAGSANLTNISGQGRTITYTGNNSAFTGRLIINNNVTVALNAIDSAPGNPGAFTPDQISIGAGCTLLDNAGIAFNNANGGITLAGNATINSASATVIAEPITGGFALTSAGAGTLVLSSANNTYSGGTTISGGALQMGVANALPAVGIVTDNSALDLNGFNTTIDGLAGAGTVDTLVGGTPTLTVGANGGSSSFSGTIQNSVGTLNLTKAGAGSLTLAAGYSYSGRTLVAGGTLNLSTSTTLPGAAGDLVVSNAATLNLDASAGTPLPANNVVIGTNTVLNLTLNPAANGLNVSGNLTIQANTTNVFNFGALSANPSAAAINVADGISVAGGNIVLRIIAAGLQAGTFTLIDYTGSPLSSLAGFVLDTPPGVGASLVNNTLNSSIDVIITSTVRELTWYGAGGTSWDFNTVNWKNLGSDTVYQQYTNGSVIAGDGVLFDDTLANDFVNPQPTNINLTAGFYAYPVTVDSTLPYSFSGVGGIVGPTSLVKSNTGSLALNTANTFSGGIYVYGGSVAITNDGALGVSGGAVNLGGGALQINGGITNSRPFSVSAASSVGVAANTSVQLGGAMTGAGGWSKTDDGTLTLTGTNGITGGFAVSQGTVNISGTNVLPAVVAVGNTAGLNGVLNIAGGILNARNNGGQFASSLVAGSVAGAAGDIRLTSGTISVLQQLGLGAGQGGYAGLTMSGGALGSGSYIVVGFNSDNAVFNQSGGSTIVTNNLMTIAAGGAASVGVANFSGGSFFATNAASGGMFVGENGTGTLNVSGGAALTWSVVGNIRVGRQSGSAGTINLLGGTITTPTIARGSGSAWFNFNGGTLKASAANTTFMSGLSGATIYNGGAIIDDGGFSVTIPQPLLAPTDYGVSSIALSSGGSGYIDTPIVTISGGSGSNATATATVSGGVVSAVNITSPGVGYNNADSLTVSFSGGGATPTTPVVSTISFAQSTTGGLTKKGSGTLTLTGVNTFKGPITNSAGTLALNSASTYAGNVNVNAGSVSLTTASIITGNTTVSNGAVLSIVQSGSANASISNITLNGSVAIPGATLALGVTSANNPAVPLLNCGTLTVNGANTINLAGAVKVGATALVKYIGAIAGSGSYTNLVLPQGATGFVSNDVANSTLYAVVTSTGPGIVWTGTNSNPSLTNLWDINSTLNWLVGSTATSYRQTIIPGDAVTFNDTGSGSVILNSIVGPASLTISNNTKNYTFGGTGTVSGPTGLQKLGTGTAILNLTNNSYAGDTTVGEGTLQLGSVSAIPSSGNVSVASFGTLELAGISATIGALSGSGVVDNNSGVNVLLTMNSASNVTWNGTIHDQGAAGVALAKTGTGTWIIGGSNYLNNGDAFNVQNQFNAGTTILTNGGLLGISYSEFRISQAGSTSTVVVAGGTLAVSNNWLYIGYGSNSASGTLIVNNGTVEKAGNNNIVVGAAGANGTLLVNGGQVLNSGMLWLGDGATANGSLQLNGGLVQATQVRPNNAPVSSIANFNGGTLQARAASADFIQSTAMIQSGGLVLDDNGFVLSQATSSLQEDGASPGGGLVKKGAGTLYLDTANSYTGITIVTNGTLAGIGSINGPVAVGPAGSIGAGDAELLGTLTLNNTAITVQGKAAMRISKTGGTLVSDLITGISTANYGGTLSISNATSDGTALAIGDTFQLFNATSSGGNFTNIAGSPGSGLAYSFNSSSGVLSVVGGTANYPTNITFSVSGGTMTVTWPSTHLGWILQAQTNALTKGLGTNWADIAGSSATTSVNLNIAPTNPAVFLRLRAP